MPKIDSMFTLVTILVITTLLLTSTPNTFAHRLSHREARKLLKLIFAASLFAPPGFGVLPIPLPVPVPFAVESVKPPIIHPFPAHSGFGGGGGGGYGGGLHFGGGFHG